MVSKDEILVKNIDLETKVIAEGKMDSGIICLTELMKEQGDLIIYSAGIGDQIDFEVDLINTIKRMGRRCQLYTFDPTPRSIEFIRKQQLPSEIIFLPFAIADISGKTKFALPTADGWISGSAANVKNDERNFDFNNMITVETRSIKDIMTTMGHSKIDLLKLDIEGSEFDVIKDICCSRLNINQMCIDYHDYMFEKGEKLLEKMQDELKEAGYNIFYIEEDVKKCKSLSCIKI